MQKHKILAFLLALIVSICLWFYAVTVVNPDDSTTINGISVQFEGLDALTARGLMLTGGDDTKVSVKMRARRSDLKELNNETVSATADVSRISASGEYQLTWNLVLPDTVATGDVSEISSIPSRFTVRVSEIKTNPDVPVKVEYTGELADGLTYQENTASLTPATLKLSGPADEVNKVDHAQVKVDLTGATTLIDEEYPYTLYDSDGNELTLSKYTTVSSEKIYVRLPILHYKDVKLKIDVVSGGGATEQDLEWTIEPKAIRVTGNDKDLQEMPDELSVATVNLAEMNVYSQTMTAKLNLPSGIINLSDEDSVEIRLKLSGLTTKEITVPVSQIERKNEEQTMSFGTQSVKIQIRGKATALENITAADLRVIADMASGYDSKTKNVTLEVSMIASLADVGVIGGPYTVPVILNGEMES